jgi:hypothetical protein
LQDWTKEQRAEGKENHPVFAWQGGKEAKTPLLAK